MNTDQQPRLPIEACRQFMPHCLPCPYSVGQRAISCPLLADYYISEKEFSMELGQWALRYVQQQATV